MLEINPSALLRAATMLARLHVAFGNLTQAQDEILTDPSIQIILQSVIEFRAEAENVGAKLSIMAADRMIRALSQKPCPLTVGSAVSAIFDIESRFADHISDIKMMATPEAEVYLFSDADTLIELPGFSLNFPRASFEVEESAKCLAFARYNGAVFHAMRMLEMGIKALSKRLNIEDPIKPAERNWATILGKIKMRIDELWPSKSRMPGSEGAQFEMLYATLEAIRNPWRNSTMHVETIYAPHEAMHILRCSAFFMQKLSKLTDEEGAPSPSMQMHLADAQETGRR